MKPLVTTANDQPIIYACAHWRSFPPFGASGPLSPEELRAQGHIQESEYQRFLVWKRVCGLTKMDAEKCMKCPLIRIAETKKGLPVLTTLDKTHSVPAVDLPTLELRPQGIQKAHSRIRPNPVSTNPGGKVS